MVAKVNVGIIGCGNIAPAYVKGSRAFRILDVVACADIDHSKAEALAAEYNIPRIHTVEGLLADPDIEIVINLTIPAAHTEINLAAIGAGKHVHSEKPLALNRADGAATLKAAAAKGLRVGCAPDTFLGGGLQTCRKLIDDGWIGQPVAATAFMMGRGPESWHPNPVFFYQPGAGPMFDMGPYYLTALTILLGPVKRIAGAANVSFPERIATSEARFGERIPVNTPTHVAGLLEFAAGPVGTIITSFDIAGGADLPRIEIYGSEGTLSVPDPNTFGGPVRIRRLGAQEWSDIPFTHSPDVRRGVGVADMAYAIQSGRAHRASGQLAYHVLDLMQSFLESSEAGQHLAIQSTVERPAPLPLGLLAGTLDE